MDVRHNCAANRFEIPLEKGTAVLDYALSGGVAVITHTEVPPALRGLGLAEKLARAALAWAEGEGLAVEPRCDYVAAFIRRHPEFRHLVRDSA